MQGSANGCTRSMKAHTFNECFSERIYLVSKKEVVSSLFVDVCMRIGAPLYLKG